MKAIRILIVVLLCLTALPSCGSGESPESAASDPDAIRLNAQAVGGGRLFYEDLASEDTVLWFWAPW